MEITTKAFGAYDIRGIYPSEVNEDFAYFIARAYSDIYKPQKIVVGRDIRLSGESIKDSLIKGFNDAGVDVLDIGECGTEMIYYTTAFHQLDGGVMVTASHNPKDYNGLKLVTKDSRPISEDTGLQDIAQKILAHDFKKCREQKGTIEKRDIKEEYLAYLLEKIDVKNLKPLTVVINTGNGAAGPVINALEKHLPIKMVKLLNQPDGTFPNGVPNPLLKDNRDLTRQKVIEMKAYLGVAFDGDFDRCFFVDEEGTFIEGYYTVGLFASHFLEQNKGEKVIYDPRVYWNTIDIIDKFSGIPVMCKSGHAFIKERMRHEDAIYGGEMSAHHYFRDFFYCDSGIFPFLLMLHILSKSGKPLSTLVKERMEKYPCSGEINSKVTDAKKVFARIEEEYGKHGKITNVDGLSIEYSDWRFNLRMSKTEPMIRLNVETRGDKDLLQQKTEELLAKIRL